MLTDEDMEMMFPLFEEYSLGTLAIVRAPPHADACSVVQERCYATILAPLEVFFVRSTTPKLQY